MRTPVVRFFSIVLVFSMAALTHAAEWDAPKDGKLTEKQVENYAAAQKDIFQLMKALGKAVEGSKSGVGALAITAGLDDKVNAILAKHDLKKPEYDWVSEQVTKATGLAMMDDVLDKAKDDMVAQRKKTADDLAAAQKSVADYEQALKSGKRVLTKERREELVKSAKEAQDAAAEEVKQHEIEAKDAGDEAAKADGEAKAADDLAKKPPSDVDADSRADFIKGKQEEAATARNTGKEIRERQKEAMKAVAESKAKMAAAGNQMKNPEVPINDEEKAQVKAENESGLASAKGEVETLTQAAGLLKDGDAQWQKQRAEMHKEVLEDNLVVVKKHLKEIQAAWGIEEKKN